MKKNSIYVVYKIIKMLYYIIIGFLLGLNMYTLSSKNVKARTTHKCSTCYRTINKGETYLKTAHNDNGDIYTWKECKHCEVYVESLDYNVIENLDGSYDNDSIADNMYDYLLSKKGSLKDIRNFVYFRNGWRNSKGELYPIPQFD